MTASEGGREHLKRAVVVVSLVGGILLFLWWSPIALFNFAVAAAAVLATQELYAMFGVAQRDRVLHAIGLAAAAGLVLQMALLPPATLAVSIPLLIMIILSVLAFRTRGPSGTELETALVVIFGALYIPVMLGQVIYIRASERGLEWVAIVVVAIFTREISAHFAGKLFRRSKPLNVNINEHKSYVGAVIGAAAASAAALLMSRYLIVGITTVQALAFGACLGIACQLGDFSESYLKRVSGFRHSGKLLGPEGGVLDFVDAAAFAIVTARLLMLVWEFQSAGAAGRGTS
jgi:phosphatidate cytidylyltransferase